MEVHPPVGDGEPARPPVPESREDHADLAMAMLAAIVDSSSDVIITTSLDGRIAFWNRAAEHVFGHSEAEAIGQPTTLIVPPERIEEERLVLTRVARGESVEDFQTIRRTKDGRDLEISFTIAPIRALSGRIVGASTVARDIGEMRLGREARTRLAAIVESSDDAIIGRTLDGVIESWNHGAESLFGYTSAEAVGRNITMIVPPDRLDEEDNAMRLVRSGQRIDHFETARRRKDGTLVDVSLTISPIRDAIGQVVGASKIARDIGERKRFDRERQSALERERAARAEAEQLTRSRDEFLSTLSHELRSPLNAILGW